MNKKITPYIYLFLLSCFSQGVFCQKLTLKVEGIDSIQTKSIDQTNYIKNHDNKASILTELSLIQTQLKKIGFFTSKLDTLIKDKNNFSAIFNLGRKTKQIVLIIPKKYQYLNYDTKKDSVIIETKDLEIFTNSILSILENEGNSFSEISYINPKYIVDTIFLELLIEKSQKRKIDKTLIKGYENFPVSFLKNYFSIKKNEVFSKEKMKKISDLTNSLKFVKEIKKPEVLFKKDSTFLYIYLKKVEFSSFEGIINFASRENGDGLLLNGNIDLRLNNILDYGEEFELFWNRVAEEKSEFKFSTKTPYLFKSSISAYLGFRVYRQDSTFLNTTFDLKTEYQLNSKSKISINVSSENSNYLLNDSNTSIDNYKNSFIGVGYNFVIPSKNQLYKEKLNLNLLYSSGQRKTDIKKLNQQKIGLNAIINITTSKRSYINIRNESNYLKSDNYLNNELYRIGGINSIRGFNEQSIFTNKYSFLNLEYRYLSSSSSYLYSISDFGYYNNLDNKTEYILGVGAGYSFKVKSSVINLSYIIGSDLNSSSNLKNSKLAVQWVSFF